MRPSHGKPCLSTSTPLAGVEWAACAVGAGAAGAVFGAGGTGTFAVAVEVGVGAAGAVKDGAATAIEGATVAG